MKDRNTIWVKLTLLVASSLTIMSSATIAPSLPQMTEVFQNEPHADVLSKLILTFPALFIAIGAPLAGLIIDRFGRKKLLIAGLILYAIAGTGGVYLDTLYGLLVSRAVLGIAVAAIMTTSTTLIGDYLEGEERNRFMGLQGATMALGGVIYILLGGYLADISWRGPFYIYLFSLALLPFGLFSIYEPEKKSFDLSHQHKNEKTPKGIIAMVFLTGLAGMILFYMVPVQLPFYLTKISDISNVKVGMAIASSTLTGAIVSSQYQKIRRSLRFPVIYAVTFAFMAAGYLIIGNSDYYWVVVAGLVVNGLGMGLMMPNGSTWLMVITPVPIRGRVVGGMTMAVFTGQFLSPLILQPLVSEVGIGAAFSISGVIMAGITGIFILTSRFTKN